MALEKASGVYLTITDNSFQTGGTQEMKVIVPMLTQKGVIGLNTVTADDYKDILGYDLSYNSNYYGLSKMVEKVSYLYVWRLNQNAKLANAYFADKSSAKEYNADAETVEDVTKMSPTPLLAVGNKYVGNWQTSAVKFAPQATESTVSNKNATTSVPQTITFDDVSATEKKTYDEQEILGSCIFYDSSASSVVGIVKKNLDGDYRAYKVVDGTIVDDETGVTYYAWTESTTPFTVYTLSETPATTDAVYIKNGSAFEIDATTTIDSVSGTSIVTVGTYAGTADRDSASDKTVFVDNSVGKAEFNDTALTITLTKTFSKDSFWTAKTIPSTIKDWTLTLASYDGRNYTIKNSYDFSTDSDSDTYYENVDFGDLFLSLDGSIPADWDAIRDYFLLEGGTNGDESISPIEIDTSVLENCGCNIMAMNGITDYKVVNRIANKATSLKIHMFVDAPAYANYVDLETWAKKITNSEYIAIGARPDTEEDDDGKTIYIYPSVNYVAIYSNMLSSFGYLNYPPAGATYGTISVSDLMTCDYDKYANELKTNRINWQCSNTVGTMMWEQRTTYALSTDLSYIAPTFIVDALADEIVTFEKNFNFRYMTRTELLNQESGLKAILDTYVTNNFLSEYELKVPTFAEAQAAGRTLTINIAVAIMKDAEVININLVLQNYS